MTQADLLALIRQKALAQGVDPETAITIARIESGMDPNSNVNASTQYKGLFQLGKDEWSQYGKGSVYDPAANTDAFLNLYKNNFNQLSQKLGRAPTPGEAYLAHQQGVTGAAALLQNPDKNAVDVIAPYYKDRATAVAAIKGNGGNPNGTAGDFANLWVNKFNNSAGVMPQTAQATPTDTTTTGLLASPPTQAQASQLDPTKLALGLLAAGQPQAMPVTPLQPMIHKPQYFTGLLG